MAGCNHALLSIKGALGGISVRNLFGKLSGREFASATRAAKRASNGNGTTQVCIESANPDTLRHPGIGGDASQRVISMRLILEGAR